MRRPLPRPLEPPLGKYRCLFWNLREECCRMVVTRAREQVCEPLSEHSCSKQSVCEKLSFLENLKRNGHFTHRDQTAIWEQKSSIVAVVGVAAVVAVVVLLLLLLSSLLLLSLCCRGLLSLLLSLLLLWEGCGI